MEILVAKVKEWKSPNGIASKYGFIDYKNHTGADTALINASKNPEIISCFLNSQPYIGLH